jgi:hypothetical protein
MHFEGTHAFVFRIIQDRNQADDSAIIHNFDAVASLPVILLAQISGNNHLTFAVDLASGVPVVFRNQQILYPTKASNSRNRRSCIRRGRRIQESADLASDEGAEFTEPQILYPASPLHSVVGKSCIRRRSRVHETTDLISSEAVEFRNWQIFDPESPPNSRSGRSCIRQEHRIQESADREFGAPAPFTTRS